MPKDKALLLSPKDKALARLKQDAKSDIVIIHIEIKSYVSNVLKIL